MTRLMIIGLARSGTTVLHKLIGSFTNVHTIPESHFFDYHFQYYNLFGFKYFKKKRPFNLNVIENNIGYPLHHIKKINPRTKKEYVSEFMLVMDYIASQYGKEIWLEKTPSHLEFIPMIETYTEEIEFIHLLRNPIDNVSSLVRASRQYPQYFKHQDIYKAIKRYRNYFDISIKHRMKKRHHLVKYENLCDDTPRYIAHFKDKFELKETEKSCSRNIVHKHEKWKDKSISQDIEKQTNKFETLTKKEIKLLKDSMQKDMIMYNKLEDDVN